MTGQLEGMSPSNLFDIYLDSSRLGFEANVIPLLFHNCRSLQERFDSVCVLPSLAADNA